MTYRTTATLLLLLTALSARGADDKDKDAPLKALKFRNVGPAAGGRVARACGVPGDPLTYYAATAGGGVWKSSDGGLNWKAIFDDQPVSSIGSIAVAPSDPNVIYVGSGEANTRGNVGAGAGIFKSTDAGQTWSQVWKNVGQIGTMIVHPTNPDIAFAAVLGSPFGPGKDRGVYRTTDGGKSWQQVLAKDADTGSSDVCFDPNNPRTLFAGLWQMRRKPWEFTSGGPGSGLSVSHDGGDTWKSLDPGEKGLPKGSWGKVGIAVAPSNSQRVYVLIEADKGGLFRSEDGGDSWKRVNDSRPIRQRAWYYSTLTVDPVNPDVVWCPQVPMLKSIDGGLTFKVVKGLHHGDNHDLWIDPKNPRRMIGANDGGVDLSLDGGKTWIAPPLPISQFYHVNCDNAVPYRVMGNMQDLGTAAGPSNSLSASGIALTDWLAVGGGETGFTVPDPSDPDVIYSGEYGGFLSRYDRRTRQARDVSAWPYDPSGLAPADMKYRFQWTAPVMFSPHDSKVLYHAAQVIFRTRDGGQKWEKISGDLTRNDKNKQQWSGGPITGDNTGVEIFGTVFAIAESFKTKDQLWAGSDDGLVHVSPDGGKTWKNVTAAIPGPPDWATVVCIEPSHFDADTAYLVAEAHRLDDYKPYLWKTADAGKTWTSLSAKLPQDIYLHAVREDPTRKGLLYLGTERGIAYSTDDGVTWQPLKNNLPTVAVHDLQVKDNDLVVGTMGRSLWILDDITPLREMTPAIAEKPAHLFAPPPAARWRYAGDASGGRGSTENPPAGAAIAYYLSKKPSKPIKLEILDGKGKVVAKMESKEEKDKDKEAGKEGEQFKKVEDDDDADGDGDEPDGGPLKVKPVVIPADVGVNRFVWDFGMLPPEIIPGAKVDAGDPTGGPVAPPGEYTLRLTVEGQKLTGKLLLKPDPRVKDDLAGQHQFSVQLRDDITRLSGVVQQLRAVRKQLADRNELLEGDAKYEPLIKDSKALVTKLDALENKLHNPKAKVTYDIFAAKGGAMLYSQLSSLFQFVKDADGPPTQGMREVYRDLAGELKKLTEEFRTLTGTDLAKLNEQAKKLEVPTVFVPAVKLLNDKERPKPTGPVKRGG